MKNFSEKKNNLIEKIASNDDFIFLSSGNYSECTIKIININTKKVVKTFIAGKKNLTTLSINDKFIFTGDHRGKIDVWDINTTELIKSIKLQRDDMINEIIINNKYIFVGSLNTIYMIDLNILEVVKILEFDGKYNQANHLAIKDNLLFSAHPDKTIKILDINTGKFLYKLMGFDDGEGVVFDENSNILSHSKNAKKHFMKVLGNPLKIEAI